VTVVHPRTTNRGPAAWERLAGRRIDAEEMVEDLSVTAFDGRCWQVAATVPLGG
jgi:hypothetical protein